MRSHVAVLASGGLDSSVMLAQVAHDADRVFPIYIRAGLRWERAEIAVLRRFVAAIDKGNIARLTILEFPTRDIVRDDWTLSGKVPGFRAAMESNYIPGRNLALLSKAAIFCARNRIGRIAMASLRGNPFPDATPAFLRAFERTVDAGIGLPLKVLTPFAKLEKRDVVRRGKDLPLELTLSCANPRGLRHCGECTKCAERVEGFRDAGVVDPTRYARRPSV